jgi:predicted GNAT family N-acyltransferase
MKYIKLFEEYEHRFLESRISNLIKPYRKLGLTIDLYPRFGNSIYLSMLEVPNELKGQGYAKKLMQDMITFADNYNLIINLTPSSKFGSDILKLKDFYSNFGFIKNNNKLYVGAMIRYPNESSGRSATS